MIKDFFNKNSYLIQETCKNMLLLGIILLILELTNILNVRRFIRLDLLYIISIISGMIWFMLWYRTHNEKQKELLKNIIKYTFLLLLFLVTISSLKFSWINWLSKPLLNIQIYLVALCIVFGIITFWQNKEVIGDIEEEKIQEELEEEKRKMEFSKKFPKINKIPIFKSIVKWMYKEGWMYVLGLILIIFIFIMLKVPYYDNNLLESPNFDKFRSYLPNLINSYQNKNPFHSENNFYGTVGDYGNRNYSYIDSFPFYTWSLYPFMFLTKYIPFLLLVRYLMTFLDTVIVISIYFLFKRIMSKKIAIFGALFLSVNTFFHNYFFVTITDRPALIFLIISMTLYLDSKKQQSYLFAGFSFLMKQSFALIFFPFLTIMILTEKKDFKDKLINFIKFGVLSTLPYLLFILILRKIPFYSPLIPLFLLVATISIVIMIYILLMHKKINQYILTIYTEKRNLTIIILALISIPLIIFLYVMYTQALNLAQNFLPEMSIIFNSKMYYFIFIQFENYFPKFIWLFITMGLLGIIFYKIKYRTMLAIIISTLFYVMVSSKGVFFHNYYRHIIIICFILIVCYFIQIIMNLTKEKYLNIAAVSLIVLVFTYVSYDIYDIEAKRMSKSFDNKEGFLETANYLKIVVKPNQRIIENGYGIREGIILLSFRSPASFSETIRSEIHDSGFTNTMNKYNVTYYVSEGESDFTDLLYLFEPISVSIIPTRSEHILYRISDEYRKKYKDTQFVDLSSQIVKTKLLVNLDESNNKYNPEQYFELEKVIGNYYIYKLK